MRIIKQTFFVIKRDFNMVIYKPKMLHYKCFMYIIIGSISGEAKNQYFRDLTVETITFKLETSIYFKKKGNKIYNNT